MSKRSIIISVVAILLFIAALFSVSMDFKPKDIILESDDDLDQDSNQEPEPEPEPEVEPDINSDALPEPEPVITKKPGKNVGK